MIVSFQVLFPGFRFTNSKIHQPAPRTTAARAAAVAQGIRAPRFGCCCCSNQAPDSTLKPKPLFNFCIFHFQNLQSSIFNLQSSSFHCSCSILAAAAVANLTHLPPNSFSQAPPPLTPLSLFIMQMKRKQLHAEAVDGGWGGSEARGLNSNSSSSSNNNSNNISSSI